MKTIRTLLIHLLGGFTAEELKWAKLATELAVWQEAARKASNRAQ